MRFPLVALALVLAAIVIPAGAQPAATPAALTLDEAMRLAEAAQPSVLAREAQLAAAEGTRREPLRGCSTTPNSVPKPYAADPVDPSAHGTNGVSASRSPSKPAGSRPSGAKPPPPAWTRCAPRSTTSAAKHASKPRHASSPCCRHSGACNWNSVRWTCSSAAPRRWPSAAPRARTRGSMPTWRWSRPSVRAMHWRWRASA